MSARIPMRYAVALQGFSDFERSALVSFFRLAAHREPAYLQGASLEACDFIVANGDHPATVHEMAEAGRLGDTVFVGARPPAGAGAWLRRPIEPTHIVRALDAMIERRRLAPPRVPDATSTAAHPPIDVLVVDDSRIASAFLQRRLEDRGFRVNVAHSAHEALERLRAHRFAMVFLDLVLGPDGSAGGLALCQHIKRHLRPDAPPAVVMVTGCDSATDRVRGQLAGCDAYLVKPVMDRALADALRSLEGVER